MSAAWVPAAIQGGASLMGNIFSTVGAKYSADRAHAENEWAMRENQQYNTFMANTAHQREVADLSAAGLNPILSGTGGGGAMSLSSGAVGASQPDFGRVGSAISSDAKSMIDTIIQLKLADASVRKMDAESAAAKDNAVLSLANLDKVSSATDVDKSMKALNEAVRRLREAEKPGVEAESRQAEAESRIRGNSLYQLIDALTEQLGRIIPFAPGARGRHSNSGGYR